MPLRHIEGTELFLQQFLTWAPDKDEKSSSRPDRLIPRKKLCYPLLKRLGGPQSLSELCVEEKNFFLLVGFEPLLPGP